MKWEILQQTSMKFIKAQEPYLKNLYFTKLGGNLKEMDAVLDA